MKKKGTDDYADFSNVKSIHDDLIPEEFPEGSFGSSLSEDSPVQGKSTPWEKGQHRESAYIYADKEIHEGLPRKTPGAHPLHDEPD